ncbi:MAG TPA: hypothetical protein VFK79_08115 [Xanthobacteraceae bacterium]|nr:hypothetical protein [Xanthobacteraceae bacterium]
MAKKKPVSIAERLGQAVSNVVNAASVAATGSEVGVLELAAEDELGRRPVKRPRKVKTAPKKKRTMAKKSSKSTTKKRAVKRRQRSRH